MAIVFSSGLVSHFIAHFTILNWWCLMVPVPRSLASSSFQSGKSSSIGVLPSGTFPTESAQNIPFEGITPVKADCGWSFAAAGSTFPGFYQVPNFGSFNLGSGNVGQSNVGFNNIGFGNYGQDNVGRLNNGNGNNGYMNDGNNNMGALNSGTSQIGDNNTGNSINTGNLQCIGYNNTQCSGVIGSLTLKSTYSVGTQLEGSFIFGSSSVGNGLIGSDNFDEFSVGFQNEGGDVNGAGNIGVLNTGNALIGYNNTGNTIIGQDNDGTSIIGLQNTGTLQIGSNNGPSDGTSNIGFNQSGDGNVGVDNTGNNNTGFGLTGDNLVGGTYIDTSSIALSEPIIFDPVTSPVPNIGTSYNSQTNLNETRLQVSTPAIFKINSRFKVNLLLPAVLSVVDLGCPGDFIQVFVSGSLKMITTAPVTVDNIHLCMGLNDPDSALADPIYSRGFINLSPGCHMISFETPKGLTARGTSLAFRIDYIKPDQPKKCTAPLPPLIPFNDSPLVQPQSFEAFDYIEDGEDFDQKNFKKSKK